jgi:CTP synthase
MSSVVGLMTEWLKGNMEKRRETGDLGTMGSALIRPSSPRPEIAEIYGVQISERHRHRYEVNVDTERLEDCGLVRRHVARRRAAGNGRIS